MSELYDCGRDIGLSKEEIVSDVVEVAHEM
jgi:hypothetical protein